MHTIWRFVNVLVGLEWMREGPVTSWLVSVDASSTLHTVSVTADNMSYSFKKESYDHIYIPYLKLCKKFFRISLKKSTRDPSKKS